MNTEERFLAILALAALPFAAAMVLLLTTIFGPSEFAVRCGRTGGAAGRCEVLQTRFLGLFGNSSFSIAESDISGARTVCATRGVGARSNASCTVDLLLRHGPYRVYPILSYPLFDQAESSTRKLNAYFADRSVASLALEDDVARIVLIVGGPPLLVVAVVLALRRWIRRKRIGSECKQGASDQVPCAHLPRS